MAYQKPPIFVSKVFNRVAMATGIGGCERLTVKGRTSGRPQEIPVIPLELNGGRYLVSTRGESQWVKNVRASPTLTVTNKSGSTDYHATELPVSERPPIIEAYRSKAGKTVETYWKQLPDPADHPVFKLA